MGLRPSQGDETRHRGAGRQACRAESHLGFSSFHGGVIFNRAVSALVSERVLSQ